MPILRFVIILCHKTDKITIKYSAAVWDHETLFNEREVKVERCLLDISLTFKIKLKTGFFKTQPYDLSIGKGQIILTPQEDNLNRRLVINEEDIQSICISIGNVSAGELEIITACKSYLASFTDQTCLEEVAKVFAKEIGRRLIFQDELF